jgi:hypothetical protein
MSSIHLLTVSFESDTFSISFAALSPRTHRTISFAAGNTSVSPIVCGFPSLAIIKLA